MMPTREEALENAIDRIETERADQRTDPREADAAAADEWAGRER